MMSYLPREWEGGIKGALVIAALFSLFLIYPASCTQIDYNVTSGDVYSYQVPQQNDGRTYEYLWSASDGTSDSFIDRIFAWTPPEVALPTEVTINVTVSRIEPSCAASNEIRLMVNPMPIGENISEELPGGQINLDKLFEGDPNEVELGDAVSYTIIINNTGHTNVTFLPLVDSYPNAFLEPVGSDPQWNQDSGSNLSWNNLLSSPLAPKHSIEVSVSFRVINITDEVITNLARVEDAKDDTGATLYLQEASSMINGIKYECQTLGPDTGCVEKKMPFSAHLELPSYRWNALDSQGNSVGGFDDPTRANVNWTPPGLGTFEISFNNLICRQTITVKQCNSRIEIDKNCEYGSPVRVGDVVTYVYNITNKGDLPLKDVNVTDIPEWGPGCTPKYIRGDSNGDNILDMLEIWRYECVCRVPDPLDYQRLSIMSNQPAAQQEKIIRRMMSSRVRLEVMLNKLKLLRSSFSKTLAPKKAESIEIKGVNYTRYNYTGKLAGEVLIETLDRTGIINSSMYIDPISESTLTTRYGNKGQLIFDAYKSNRTKESLEIEYDRPAKGYKTYTIVDNANGDSLIMIIDSKGGILSKKYRKTPGEKIFKAYLKNVATVIASDTSGGTVSDMDAYLLEVEGSLPELSIIKKAEPNPIQAGKTLTYTISYQNAKNGSAHSVFITENYDKNVTFVSSYPLPATGSNNVWSLGDLASGVSGTIKINVKVNPSVQDGYLLKNTAEISCAEGVKAGAGVNTTVLGSLPVLLINKTASQDMIGNSTEFYYTITYRNSGETNATNVIVDDIVDQNLDFLSSNPEPSSGNAFHKIWSSSRLKTETLIPGASGTIVMHMRAKETIPKSVRKVYNLYRISSGKTQGTYNNLETEVLHGLYVRKTAEKCSYSQGRLVNYTIFYGNDEPEWGPKAQEVNIMDTLPDVDFVEASPPPSIVQGKILVWDIGELAPQKNGTIYLTVLIRERPNMRYDETGSVSGKGYVYSRKMLSTNLEPYTLTNFVKINGYYDINNDGNPEFQKNDSDSNTVGVSDPGTEIETVEHGSGYYQQEQQVRYNNSNKSISLDEKTFAKHEPATLPLSRNRNISFNSLWFDRTYARNYVKNDKVSENYLYMDLISKDSSFLVDPNQTVYKSTGDFYGGTAQIAFTKSKPSTIHGLSDNYVDVSENYHGSFKIGQSLDSYGEGVSYSKSAKGLGFVASDKKIGNTQRSFEAGSGDYQSSEMMKNGVIYKDSRMTYIPNNQMAGSFNINYSSKWHEEMRTNNPDIGATISERIGSADDIMKETIMQDATMSMLARFNGTADIRAVQQINPEAKENVSIDQTFIGSYELDTTISINQGPIYIRPHINITKEVLKQDAHTALFRINLSNDGNKTLGPIYVTDSLPEGLTFINSSQRPDTTGRDITWSLPMLQIGGKQSIILRAGIEDTGSRFINRVNVSAEYKGGVVTDRAACSFVLDGLPCCLTEKSALMLPKKVPNHSNNADVDWVPPKCFGMDLNLSEYPLDQEIPCSSCSIDIPKNGG